MVTPHHLTHQARTWLGTRFHHQGRLKKTATHAGGCDCIGLIVGIAKELALPSPLEPGKLLAEHDILGYGRMPNGGQLQAALAELFKEKPLEAIEEGDLLLFRFDGNPQHVGLATQYVGGGLGLIHCYAQARKVVEHSLDQQWRQRLVAAYRLLQ